MVTLLSVKLVELNIDKEQLIVRLKRLLEYEKLENKLRKGVNSYCNTSNDSQRTKSPLAPNSHRYTHA